jgi:hypothetical protein
MHNDHERLRGEEAHRCEVLHRVEGQVAVEGRVEREARVREEQRVAVRRCLGHESSTERRARATPVFDDHWLTQRLVELLGQHAADEIGAAARRSRTDDAYGLLRIRLRGAPAWQREQRRRYQYCSHDFLLGRRDRFYRAPRGETRFRV